MVWLNATRYNRAAAGAIISFSKKGGIVFTTKSKNKGGNENSTAEQPDATSENLDLFMALKPGAGPKMFGHNPLGPGWAIYKFEGAKNEAIELFGQNPSSNNDTIFKYDDSDSTANAITLDKKMNVEQTRFSRQKTNSHNLLLGKYMNWIVYESNDQFYILMDKSNDSALIYTTYELPDSILFIPTARDENGRVTNRKSISLKDKK